jgi:NAD(P)-dependent dehydrogenase (short-subunit alcohol dehydrogenase family)
MSLPTLLTGHPAPSDYPPLVLTGLSKLRWAVKHPPADPGVTFAGKTILVTGANAGLGFEAAVKSAQKGCAKLILAVRSVDKGETAKKAILERSNRKSGDFISILIVDLTRFESLQKFARALNNECATTGLHIALLNAGIANPSFTTGPHGYEQALQVNVLSTALMAHLIVPLLRRTAATSKEKPHLTFVNSFGHTEPQKSWYAGPPSNGSLLAFTNTPALFDQRKAYTSVKLLGMSVMLHYARTLVSADGTPDVIVNSCCPFFCRTELGRNFSTVWKTVFGAAQRFTARSAEEGARTLVGASVLGSESVGAFWHHDVLYP